MGFCKPRSQERDPSTSSGQALGDPHVASFEPQGRSGSPAVAGLEDVLPNDVVPGDERNQDDDYEDALDVQGSRGCDLVVEPQRQSEGQEVDRFPGELEEQQGDHLDGVAQTKYGGEADAGEQGDSDAFGCGELWSVVEDGGPDVKAEACGEDQVAGAEGV